MDEVEDFLAHVGVKGMKWGVRKDGSSGSYRGPSPELLKKIGTEIGFGSLGPAAILAGLGPPVSIAIGVSVAVLRQPPVRRAMAETTKASTALMREIGDTKITAMREAREVKAATKRAYDKAEPRLQKAANAVNKAYDAAGTAHDIYTSPAVTVARLI